MKQMPSLSPSKLLSVPLAFGSIFSSVPAGVTPVALSPATRAAVGAGASRGASSAFRVSPLSTEGDLVRACFLFSDSSRLFHNTLHKLPGVLGARVLEQVTGVQRSSGKPPALAWQGWGVEASGVARALWLPMASGLAGCKTPQSPAPGPWPCPGRTHSGSISGHFLAFPPGG